METQRKRRVFAIAAATVLVTYGIGAIVAANVIGMDDTEAGPDDWLLMSGLVALLLLCLLPFGLSHIDPTPADRFMQGLIEQWDADRKLVQRWRTGSLPRPNSHRSDPVARSHISVREWRQILELWETRCAYCGSELSDGTQVHKEHVIPLARGGADAPTNIVPSCAPCNLAKGTRTGLEYIELRKSRKQVTNAHFSKRVNGDGEPSPPDAVMAAMERLDEVTETARIIGRRNHPPKARRN